ncbi:MAG: alpha/beta fold hydrolase, partial [Sphingomicrobium sp.]
MSLLAVQMPKWGLAMDEGTLASWLVEEGAIVSAGDEIAEIETSKIANVLEAPASGVLRRRVALAGDLRAVGGLLAVIASNGESDAEVDAFIAGLVAEEAAVEAAAPPKREPETIVIDGAAIRHFTVPATDPARAGTPLILIHGFGGDYLNWMFNQAVLAADRDVLAFDLPGHGGSAKEVGDGSLEALAARVLAWLDAVNLETVHLAGHSMGAAVAIALARAAPDRVRSIVAIAGAGLGATLDRSYLEDFIAAGRRKELTPVVERLFADPSIVTR